MTDEDKLLSEAYQQFKQQHHAPKLNAQLQTQLQQLSASSSSPLERRMAAKHWWYRVQGAAAAAALVYLATLVFQPDLTQPDVAQSESGYHVAYIMQGQHTVAVHDVQAPVRPTALVPVPKLPVHPSNYRVAVVEQAGVDLMLLDNEQQLLLVKRNLLQQLLLEQSGGQRVELAKIEKGAQLTLGFDQVGRIVSLASCQGQCEISD